MLGWLQTRTRQKTILERQLLKIVDTEEIFFHTISLRLYSPRAPRLSSPSHTPGSITTKMSAAALAVFGNSPTALSKTRPPKLVRQTNGTIATQLSLRLADKLEPNITENLQADTRKINNWRAKKRNYPQTSTLAYTQYF